MKVTVPLPPPVPIFIDVVPLSVPVPLVKAIETMRLFGRPTVELFPNASCVFTTGCWPKGEPARADPGWVVKASWVAVASLTVIPDCAPLRLPSLPVMDRVPAVLRVAVKLFTPASALVKAASGGKTACVSELAKWTVPV